MTSRLEAAVRECHETSPLVIPGNEPCGHDEVMANVRAHQSLAEVLCETFSKHERRILLRALVEMFRDPLDGQWADAFLENCED